MKIIIHILLLSLSLFAWKMEADTMVVKNTNNEVVTHIDFRQSYETVPLVFTLTTDSWESVSLKVTTPAVNGGSIKSLTDASDGDEGTLDGSKAEMNCQIVKKSEECSVTFDVKVK